MTEWLLILTIVTSDGVSITTTKVPDKKSCVRAGELFVQGNYGGYIPVPRYKCIEITKDKL